MIEMYPTLLDSAGCPTAGQMRGKPSVYLDHWALKNISENGSWAKRFRDGLLACQGSLAISIVNLIEFSQVGDARQVALTEQFLDSLLPNIFWQQAAYPFVIEAEKTNQRVPDSDVFLLTLFTLEARTRGWPMSMRHRLALLVGKSGFGNKDNEAVAAIIIEKIQKEYFPQIAEMRRKGVNSVLKFTRSRAEGLFMATVEYLYNRRHIPLKTNDVMDIAHMIVPVSFCDYVLLDSNTCQMVDAIRNRFEKLLDRKIQIAKVYKKSGIETFLSDLENTPVTDWVAERRAANVPAKPFSLVQEPRTVGRNALCPCGSGKRSKHCCGRLQQAT